MKKSLLALSLSVSFAVPAWAAEPLPVLTSFSILADITQQVGGERVTVSSLVGPNQDAHVYQPSPQDVKKLLASRVFVVNGLGFEGWIQRLTQSSQYRGQTVVASEKIKPLAVKTSHGHDHGHRHDHGKGVDPHAWHNPQHVIQYGHTIAQALAKADPAGASYYQQRAQQFEQQLRQLDQSIEQQFAAIPVAQRKVITSHDAFSYLGQRYQIRFIAPQGMSTESEASAASVAKLVKQIRQQKVKALFVENMADQRLLQQISQETNVKVGGKLYSDALSAGAPAGSYIELMQYNAKNLASALQ
ncbi:MAG: metal ABC transporter solute-binding protein, Zn/Mn family [Aquaspirillum sp.]